MELQPKNKFPLNGHVEYHYNYQPKTTIVINYFIALGTMLKSIHHLRSIGEELEIIVNNDRWGENTTDIMKSLTHRNDRMVIARDLGERRGYHHGFTLSNASDFIIFTQDDDLAPDNNKWYLDCLQEFQEDPKLGMIGMLKGGFNYEYKDNVTFNNEYAKVYVSWVATGPLMIRKDVYQKVGGWSDEYSQIGEADGGADADLATKVILNGFKVMLLRTPSIREWQRRVNRDDGLTNQTIKKSQERQKYEHRIRLNNEIYKKKYENHKNQIFDLIVKYNQEIGVVIKSKQLKGKAKEKKAKAKKAKAKKVKVKQAKEK